MLSLSLTLNSFTFRLRLIKLRCLLAVKLMLSMCLFHLRSDWIVTPRYFVEDSVWRVCWWSTYLWCRWKWNKHIDNISLTASKHLNFIKRNLKVNSKSVKEKAYTSLIRPNLEYSSCVWDPHTKSNIINSKWSVQQQLGAGSTAYLFSDRRSIYMSLSLYGICLYEWLCVYCRVLLSDGTSRLVGYIATRWYIILTS
jgi:hypothetical protein